MILRYVRFHEYVGACRYTGYIDKSIRLTLECGHEQHRKASAGVPEKARCRDCERAHRHTLSSHINKTGISTP